MKKSFPIQMISAVVLVSLMTISFPAQAKAPCPITHEQVNSVLVDLIFVVFDLDRNGKITREEIAVISPELAEGSFGDYVGKWNEGINRFWIGRFLEVFKPLNFIDTNRDGLIQYEEVGDDVPRELYDILDFNANGVIDCEDFDYLTQPYTEAEGEEECGSSDILALVARGGVLYVDQDGDELIGRDEILDLLSSTDDLGDNEEIFTVVFNMLDSDKDGRISAMEIHGTLLSVPINLIHIADQNRDGAIQFLEVPFVPPLLFAQLDTVVDGKLDCADYLDQLENDEIELPKGALSGIVRDKDTELPLGDAAIKLSPGAFSTKSLPVAGTFLFASLPYREYTLTVTKEGYESYSRSLRIEKTVTTLDIVLEPEIVEVPSGTVSGVVRNAETGWPVPKVLITLNPGNFSQQSDELLGSFFFTDVPTGSYTLTASKEGFLPSRKELEVEAGDVELLDISLKPEPVVEGEGVVEGEPVSDVEGELVNDVEGELVNDVEGELVNDVEGELVNDVEGELVNDVEGELVNDVEGELVNDVEGEPVNDVEGELVNDVEGEPVNDVEGELVNDVEGEKDPVTGPKGILSVAVRNKATEFPVLNAEVTLTPGKYSAVSDPTGATYHIGGIPAGTYTVTVEHPAFEPFTGSVEIKGNFLGVHLNFLDVVLTLKKAEGEDILPDVEGEDDAREGEPVSEVEGEPVSNVEGEVLTPVEGESPVTDVEGETAAPEEGEDKPGKSSGCRGNRSLNVKTLLADWLLISLSLMSIATLRSFRNR